jgi:predicted acylesterase/phospholipase RssA
VSTQATLELSICSTIALFSPAAALGTVDSRLLDERTAGWIRELVRSSEVPVVLDADGLNAFAGRAEDLADRKADVILTPDVGKIHWADFEAAEYCVEAGEKAATAAAPAIRELLRQERFRSFVRPPIGKRMAERYLAAADLRFSVE